MRLFFFAEGRVAPVTLFLSHERPAASGLRWTTSRSLVSSATVLVVDVGFASASAACFPRTRPGVPRHQPIASHLQSASRTLTMGTMHYRIAVTQPVGAVFRPASRFYRKPVGIIDPKPAAALKTALYCGKIAETASNNAGEIAFTVGITLLYQRLRSEKCSAFS